jgi:hypothetical protein
MQFSDTTNKSGILQKCELYVFGGNYGTISGNTINKAVFTGLANDALDSITSELLNTDTRWQWDDTNYTDFPIGMTNLVDSQDNYSLDVSHIKILGVEALDSTGNYYPLYPIDTRDITDQNISPTELFSTDGQPQYYDLLGNSIVLYPSPNEDQVTLSQGLKVRFQRAAEYFASTDTTKEAGFASIYHKLVPLMASYDYCMSNDMNSKASFLKSKIDTEKNMLGKYMTKRDKGSRPQITIKRQSSK